MNVTLNQLIVGFLIGVVILVLTVEKSKDFTRSKDRATLLISSMGALALLITIYDRKENIKRQLAADEYKVTMDDIANQRNNFLAPLKDILSSYPESINIYGQMFNYNQPALQAPKVAIDPIKQLMTEQAISLTIFQIVENFLTVATLTPPKTLIEWLSRLVIWFQSPIVQAQYQQYKPYFGDDAIFFIDNIIEQSNNLQDAMKQGAPFDVDTVRKYAQQIKFTPRKKK